MNANVQQFDCLMKLASFAIGRADARRQYEWKLTFGVWALLIGALIYIKVVAFPIWVGFGIIALYARWLHAILRRNTYDVKLAWEAARTANSILENKIDMPKPDFVESSEKWNVRFFGIFMNWSMALQFMFTLALIILFYTAKVDDVTWLFPSGLEIAKP